MGGSWEWPQGAPTSKWNVPMEQEQVCQLPLTPGSIVTVLPQPYAAHPSEASSPEQ